MAPISDSNTYDNTLAVIKGGTDNTSIGNNGDRLKVDAQLSAITTSNESATFIAFTQAAGVATGKSMMSFVNTTGSTVKVKIRQIKIISAQTTAVTGVICNFEFRKFVSHASGTSITTVPMDSTDTLSGSVTVRTGATITGETTTVLMRYQWSSDEWGVGSLDVEGSDHSNSVFMPVYSAPRYTKPITLNANEGFHIKHTTSSSVGSFDIEVLFTQE